jgi:cell division protein FtsL
MVGFLLGYVDNCDKVSFLPEQRKGRVHAMKMEKYLLLALAVFVLLVLVRFFY